MDADADDSGTVLIVHIDSQAGYNIGCQVVYNIESRAGFGTEIGVGF